MTIPVESGISKGKHETFEEIAGRVYALAMEYGRSLLVEILEGQDRELQKSRDKGRYRCKGKQKTSIKTKLGVIEFRRNVYADRSLSEGVHCVHLLDEALGIQKVGLMSKEVCETVAELACVTSYRTVAKTITETTGLSISPQGAWNIVQKLGQQREDQIMRHTELARQGRGTGCAASKILYEENDGVWLKLQGKDRKEQGPSKEMKVGIAYDGATWQIGKDGRKRRTLDCKAAHAGFESAEKFRERKEGVVSSRFDVEKVELRVINGDGANWIQKQKGVDCICVLDRFHRNKKLTACSKNKDFAQTARALLSANRIDDLLACIEAQINSTEDEAEQAGLRELLSYYTENKEALLGYYDRGETIPETRGPGVIHHARLGSMESNVFTLIGNRMKDRRCCWSIQGTNHLASLLCLKHTTGFALLFSNPVPLLRQEPADPETNKPLSAASLPETVGKGSECYNRATLPHIPWLKNLTRYHALSDLTF